MKTSVSISELGFENSIESFLAPLDQYPDIRVFVKDMESRYLYANKAYADMLNTTPQQMLGKSDFDLYDHNFAELYLQEDRQTLAGKDFINQRWMVPDGGGVISWCVAHKFPLRNRAGKICGIICTFRDQQMAGMEAKPFFDLAEVVEYVNAHYAEPIRAEQLAEVIGLSVSQLNRKFAKVMGKSPKTDNYVVTASPKLKTITAIKLEVLPHDSLPRKGPGRNPHNGNLHLNAITCRLFGPDSKEPVDVPIASATADFNQQGWTIAHVLDDDPRTAWGIHPQEGKKHYAVFVLKQPVAIQAGSRLAVSLEQSHGDQIQALDRTQPGLPPKRGVPKQ